MAPLMEFIMNAFGIVAIVALVVMVILAAFVLEEESKHR